MYKILFTAVILSILSCTSHKKEILMVMFQMCCFDY